MLLRLVSEYQLIYASKWKKILSILPRDMTAEDSR